MFQGPACVPSRMRNSTRPDGAAGNVAGLFGAVGANVVGAAVGAPVDGTVEDAVGATAGDAVEVETVGGLVDGVVGSAPVGDVGGAGKGTLTELDGWSEVT